MIKVKEDSRSGAIEPEVIIEKLLAGGAKEITPEAVLAELHLVPEPDDEAREAWLGRIIRELENVEDLIPAEPGKRYVTASTLFSGAEFLIVPDAFEIENNILIPGHRFAPFMAPEVFPSEVSFKEAGARRAQSFTKFSGAAEAILKYHVFMGAESLFDFFAAEDHANIASAQGSNNPVLAMSAIDMKKFYAETEFSEGDALLVTVTDYAAGKFEFRLDNGKARQPMRESVYRETFEHALETVIGSFAPGDCILDQIRSTLANAPELLKNPALSLDELLLKDSAADIVFDTDGSTLVWRTEDEEESTDEHAHHHHHHDACDCTCGHNHHHEDDDDEPVTLSNGETGSLEAMLRALYPMLNLVELDAVLLDNLNCMNYDFNSFYSRAFGEAQLPFADKAQEAIFFNALEERHEEFCEHYPREFDKAGAELRRDIVEFTIERCSLLAELAALDEHPAIEDALFTKLADATLRLDEVLKIVNHPDTLPEDCNFDAMREAVDAALDDGTNALSEMSKALDGE